MNKKDLDRCLALGKWYALQVKKGRWYAVRNIKLPNGKRSTLYLHRFLLGVGSTVEVDHRDGDTLNCRRGNLRPATNAENSRNRKGSAKSGFKGARFYSGSKKTPRWVATIMVDGKYHHLGYYNTAREAAQAYDRAAVKLHGKFAKTNFPVK